MKQPTIRTFFVSVAILTASGIGTAAYANHAWANYHWARTANPFTLKLGDNVSNAWDPYLATTSSDWSQSTVFDTTVVSGQVINVKRCRPTLGRAEVCSTAYGYNGWLGVASIWANGDHITQGTVRLNDTYFKTASYNTPAWRNLVMCQEVGHVFGLNHQDENFNNMPLETCMDYTNDPTPNQHPNQHDYDMLEQIYAHLDATSTVAQSATWKAPQLDFNSSIEWGKEIHRSADGRASFFERDLGAGQKVFTHVFWADGSHQE